MAPYIWIKVKNDMTSYVLLCYGIIELDDVKSDKAIGFLIMNSYTFRKAEGMNDKKRFGDIYGTL